MMDDELRKKMKQSLDTSMFQNWSFTERGQDAVRKKLKLQTLVRPNDLLEILASLQYEEKTGYQLLTNLEQKGCHTFYGQEGVLYPYLHRLEMECFVKSRWVMRDGEEVKIYQTTSKGRDVLTRTVEQEAKLTFKGVLGFENG
ncbi:PadR family transcriptional regulator [Halalkalibacterium halodurans]|jgi:DNA-binding PadR family transcriptional regulator|uniref:Transcription regulator PadR N-terminal domain-containing protein n=1 Tax=Halalkalibacterium halodurans TaxID=86665 RepID=A0A0M0KGE0_ALKHA|nr:PadR family transcriptional regulator [Halalkalibacterium halodurans]TPE68348.1 PadR family transcriptional regulator [Halalkalibacterium halodurans]